MTFEEFVAEQGQLLLRLALVLPGTVTWPKTLPRRHWPIPSGIGRRCVLRAARRCTCGGS